MSATVRSRGRSTFAVLVACLAAGCRYEPVEVPDLFAEPVDPIQTNGGADADANTDADPSPCALCVSGTSFAVTDTSACGHHCEACPPPVASAPANCKGTVVPTFAPNGCPTGSYCECPGGVVAYPDGSCPNNCSGCPVCVDGVSYRVTDQAPCCFFHCEACPTIVAPDPCEGRLVEVVSPATHCPEWYCVCADNTVSTDGTCPAVDCSAAGCDWSCPPGTDWFDDGSCCGGCQNACGPCQTCVPDPNTQEPRCTMVWCEEAC